MFSRIQFTIRAVIAVLVLGLCSGLWVQYQMNLKLSAKVQAQSQLIIKQEEANQELVRNLKLERDAVTSYQQAVTSLREKANETKKNIKQTLQNEKCANTFLPSDISKQLQSISSN
ncbi:hypothetical protein A6B44_09000 [Pasteurella skyensis]|uniref:DUF2570 domain-containing protein n=2 Tax=Phocoenobacter skyensis TaxID=97481 RepID=A0A1H7V7F5_9PAST|nr:DUF2570 family protein [Pasteurella skyensis]QLB23335.1 hypothetical protein A6B44_09000 [Pasteurella skyensis]SEM05171.1 Protein of unknown function [Pasteurella skyensis]